MLGTAFSFEGGWGGGNFFFPFYFGFHTKKSTAELLELFEHISTHQKLGGEGETKTKPYCGCLPGQSE